MDVKDQLYQSTTISFIEGKRDEDEKKKGNSSGFLYFAAFSASLLSFGMGTIVVWTSPVLSKLRTNDTILNPIGRPITTMEESVIGGLGFVGACIGSLVLTKLCDIIGRHKTLMGLAGFMLMADVALAFARKLYIYYISRFILSFCMGGGMSTTAIFLSEITENHNRGQVGVLIGLSFPMGNLYVYVIGPMMSIKNFTLMCALPYLVLIVMFVLFVPESPIYLASKGRKPEAIRSLEKLRNKTASEIEKEYEQIVDTWNRSSGKGVFKEFVKNKGLRKGLIIAVTMNVIVQLSGVAGILAFAGPLFDSAKMSISGNMTGILIGIIKLSSVFMAMFIVDKLGKRPLLLLSTFGSGVSHLILGSFFYLRSINSTWIDSILWLPVSAVLLYFIFYGIGLGAVVPSLTSELFPSNVKSIPVALANSINFMIGVVVLSVFPYFIRSLGPAWCLWGFSSSCFLGFAFIYFVVPEIKGKSVLEIVEILSK